MSALPEPWKSLRRAIEKLTERVRRLENRSTFFNTGLEQVDPGQLLQSGAITVPSGGLLLVDGGDVIMLNEDLVEVFRLGEMPGGDRGIQIRRSDDTVAFEVRDRLGLGTQSVGVRDTDDMLIAGTGLFPTGLGSPYIPVDWTPVDYTSGARAQTTSAATWTALHEHRGFKQNNVVWPQFMVKCSDGTTSAQVRLYSVTAGSAMTALGGAALTINIPLGTTAFTLFEFADYVHLPGTFGTPVVYQVQAQRTAGAGSVSVAPVRSIGVRDGLSSH